MRKGIIEGKQQHLGSSRETKTTEISTLNTARTIHKLGNASKMPGYYNCAVFTRGYPRVLVRICMQIVTHCHSLITGSSIKLTNQDGLGLRQNKCSLETS